MRTKEVQMLGSTLFCAALIWLATIVSQTAWPQSGNKIVYANREGIFILDGCRSSRLYRLDEPSDGYYEGWVSRISGKGDRRFGYIRDSAGRVFRFAFSGKAKLSDTQLRDVAMIGDWEDLSLRAFLNVKVSNHAISEGLNIHIYFKGERVWDSRGGFQAIGRPTYSPKSKRLYFSAAKASAERRDQNIYEFNLKSRNLSLICKGVDPIVTENGDTLYYLSAKEGLLLSHPYSKVIKRDMRTSDETTVYMSYWPKTLFRLHDVSKSGKYILGTRSRISLIAHFAREIVEIGLANGHPQKLSECDKTLSSWLSPDELSYVRE